MPSYKLQKNGLFTIKGYNQASPFSNFLPGIAGIWGIPLWAFYLNRGQAISSFGLKDKDGAVGEFYPANKAYSHTPFYGFRTFIKDQKNSFYEPFSIKKNSFSASQTMQIGSGHLEISELNSRLGLKVSVKYFTLPNEPVPALVRKVVFKNTSKVSLNLKILDGLARIIPYGASNALLKDMSRTLEAWMHTYFENNSALFRLLVDPADVAHTTYIRGANFNYAFYQKEKNKVHPFFIVDPEKIFGSDLSYAYPEKFIEKKFKFPSSQILSGKTPSAFSFFDLKINPRQEVAFYNLFGAVFDSAAVGSLTKKINVKFLEEKEKENNTIINEVKSRAFCFSGSKRFNHYLGSSYLDNILRGGFPYKLKENSSSQKALPYYVFSRKHGDPERDYNYFNLLPSFFSEGQGNYRDVNQNRRMDLFFQPCLEEKNIVYFLDLIQIDGYNPLVVMGQRLYFDLAPAQKILKKFKIKKKKFLHLMLKGFYLGEFFDMLAQEEGIFDKPGLAYSILSRAKRKGQAFHSEGYWIDHWRYNLDLIENFLKIYPDRLEKLFLNTEFTFFDDKYRIKPRRRRYVFRRGDVYQGESIEADKEKAQIIKARRDFKNLLRTADGKVYKTNLIEKFLVLILNKAASFDPHGLGIEMEADKPGWCDSLNGLPALFGSSLCETFELKRAALILGMALKQLKENKLETVSLSQNTFSFFDSLDKLIKTDNRNDSKNKNFNYWDKSNQAKEAFRRNSFYFFSNNKKNLKTYRLESFLALLAEKIDKSLKKAKDKKTNLYPSYFTYTVTGFKKVNHHPQPLKFKRATLPLFLEGAVHALRCQNSRRFFSGGRKPVRKSLALHQAVKSSDLYDPKLKMYRLNASLAGQPLDIGRSRIFNPGWLENESIWLHMEYKYLLELLKAGFYREFFSQFKNCAVCFQDPKRYGRSILENSSFLASSCHPDKSLHGKGFVARLTGATAELIDLWLLISLGPRPFFLNQKKELVFKPRPLIASWLFTAQGRQVNWQGKKIKIPANTYSFNLFSQTLVTYHNPKRIDTFSRACRLKRIELGIAGKTINFQDKVSGQFARLIRNQAVSRISLYLD